ncbi:hypothetical protein [Enterococcus sp. AZ072]|uniref:hypothetical protein n=1 Tax=unclassified Enterococcus TaxID=2608891 RepID=UPI003D2D7360
MTEKSHMTKLAQPFGKRQVFTLKKHDTLTKRLESFLFETNKTAEFIQYAIAIMIRNAFSPLNLSFIAKKQIRELFLTGKVPASVRHLCIYFQDYFETEEEWTTVINHLYKNQQEFDQLTEEARLLIKPLRPALISGEQAVDRKRNLKASFLDETGKMHNWSLSNVVCLHSPKKHMALLNILGELTVFQKDGLRQFTKVVWLDFAIDERSRDFDIRNDEDFQHKSKKNAPEKSANILSNIDTLVKSTGSNKKRNESSPNDIRQYPVEEQAQENDPIKLKNKPVKQPMDRMKKLKNDNFLNNQSKNDRNLEVEKAVRKASKGSKGKKNRKRNKRK